MPTMSAQDRAAHWIAQNHQCRLPKRHVVFDTESRFSQSGLTETQRWRMGAGIRWRLGLQTGTHDESSVFDSPLELWQWVNDYCRKGERTVIWAHNMGHDVRISDALGLLPQFGFKLEWCNLDSNVSSMTWRSDHGTLVFADTWTWLPVALQNVGADIGMRKLSMPSDKADRAKWERYCMRDAEITALVVKTLCSYISDNQLGNWQPTGAGMAYAIWRHKFMGHKVLVHDNEHALNAERDAMHTGRAEAWRHGRLEPDIWTELDMRNAYVTIASECELPVKLKYRTGSITNAQYTKLCDTYRYLGYVRVSTNVPCVPYRHQGRTLWPVGNFETWLWDTEIALLLQESQSIKILDGYAYTKAPILQEWAQWILSLLDKSRDDVPSVIKTWAKHCGRALIGRISLRTPSWEYHGTNPGDYTGITRVTDTSTGQTARLMHVGDRTLIETARTEGRDSLPQVTGWIMAECRARLWRAMSDAGTTTLAHVDTDSLLVSSGGMRALRAAQGQNWARTWQAKGSWRRVIVYGPRNYRTDSLRKAAGVPRKADEVLPNVFKGERWSGVATDLEAGRHDSVTVVTSDWQIAKADPRRRDSAGIGTLTLPYEVDACVSSVTSSSSKDGVGA
jgi:hypothetical protein